MKAEIQDDATTDNTVTVMGIIIIVVVIETEREITVIIVILIDVVATEGKKIMMINKGIDKSRTSVVIK